MAKYKVYAEYRFTVGLGEYEAESEQEAIEKAYSEASSQHVLCYQCEKEMLDHPSLDDSGFSAELIVR